MTDHPPGRPEGRDEPSASPSPPGWYPDPDVPGQTKWWNGTAWSDPPTEGHRQEAPATLPAQPITRLLVLGGAAGLILAAFLPWVSMSAPLVGTVTALGIEGDGIITAVLGAAAGVIAIPLLSRNPLTIVRAWGVIGCSLVAVLVAVVTATNVSQGAAELEVGIGQTGVGLWLTILAGLAAAAGGFTALRRSPPPTP